MLTSAWLYSLLYTLSLAASLSIGAYILAARRKRGGFELAMLLFAVAWWTLMYILEVSSGDLGYKSLFARLKYAGIALTPPLWLLFALRFSRGVRPVDRLLRTCLVLAALLLFSLTASNDSHRFMWSHEHLRPSGPFLTLGKDPGFLYWTYAAYSYCFNVSGMVIMFRALLRRGRPFRSQTLLLGLAMLAPLAGNLLTLLHLTPLDNIDYTPIGFTVSACALAVGLNRFRFLDLLPVAKDLVLNTIPDAVFTLDSRGRIIDLNAAGARLIGRDRAVAIGQDARLALPDFLQPFARAAAADQDVSTGGGGQLCWYRVRALPVQPGQGEDPALVIICTDITESHQTAERMRYLGTHDPLTGLANRTRFDEELARLEAGRITPIGVFMIDVDGLKWVNDHYGHLAGDRLLQQSAHLLQTAFRVEDLVARIGGDEFAVLLPGAGMEAMDHAAGRLRAALETQDCPPGQARLSLSAGWAEAACGAGIHQAMLQADTRMYAEKRRHKDILP